MPSARRVCIAMFEKIGNVQQADNLNRSVYFFLTFAIERLSKRLSQILGPTGESKPFTLPPTLFSQQQDLAIAYDDGSCRITYSWNQIHHIYMLR